jgi:hypothetical protein
MWSAAPTSHAAALSVIVADQAVVHPGQPSGARSIHVKSTRVPPKRVREAASVTTAQRGQDATRRPSRSPAATRAAPTSERHGQHSRNCRVCLSCRSGVSTWLACAQIVAISAIHTNA